MPSCGWNKKDYVQAISIRGAHTYTSARDHTPGQEYGFTALYVHANSTQALTFSGHDKHMQIHKHTSTNTASENIKKKKKDMKEQRTVLCRGS